MIPKAKHFDPLLGEELISLFVTCALVRKAMAAAIQFERELCQCAVKIQIVNAAGILTAEFEFVETAVAKQPPKAVFGIRRFLPKLTGKCASRRCAVANLAILRCPPPHPDPLPQWGRGELPRAFIVSLVHYSRFVRGVKLHRPVTTGLPSKMRASRPVLFWSAPGPGRPA